MAGIKTNTSIEFNDTEITINTLLQRETFPMIVKTSKNRSSHWFLGNQGMPEYKEMLLQRTMRVKYAHIKVFTSYDGARDTRDSDDIGDNHYLLPVKYHAKFRFVHRPGSRKRYAAVSQVLNDLPRFITVWENTQATDCSDLDRYTTIEAGTTLEIVRKFTRADNMHTFLECSNAETSIAFSDDERLNCTAIDDYRQYNLFELVRSKLLPRFIQFEDVDLNDIVHVDDALHNETISAVENPIELLGFTDIEMLVGCIRNETNETYETVLIPRDLWPSLYVHEEYSASKEKTESHVERLYQSVGEVYFIEKSLYLLPIHQRKVVCLIGPNFKYRHNNSNTVESEPGEENEVMYQGPVVLLPQVKKKKTLFKKVHQEILRLFKSNNEDKTTHAWLKNRPCTERRETKRYTKKTQASISKSTTSLEMRHDPMHLLYTRRHYGDASYLEFYHDNSDGRLTELSPMQLRLSVSLGDLPSATFLQMGNSSSEADDTSQSLISLQQPGDEYTEIADIPRHKEVFAKSSPLYNRQRYAHTSLFASASVPTVSRTQISVSWRDLSGNGAQGKLQNQEIFYTYNIAETYHCFKDCGLDDFAMKCKKHKLDGSFFRNFDCSLLKDEPFHLSNFTILKVKKIIQGWRPT